MPYEIHPNSERGHLDHGWLQTAHSFSFGGYVNRKRMNFGALLVLNEDIIQPGQGFAEHFHDNMEIVTIPLAGALQHADSLGNGSVIQAGDVQIMSAGTGIMHSEKNASDQEPVHLLQIWIIPDTQGLPTRYEQKTFDPALFRNTFFTVVSHDVEPSSLKIHQHAYFRLGIFDTDHPFTLELKEEGSGMFLSVIKGNIEVNGVFLNQGGALAVWDEKSIQGKALKSSHLLAIEVPLQLE